MERVKSLSDELNSVNSSSADERARLDPAGSSEQLTREEHPHGRGQHRADEWQPDSRQTSRRFSITHSSRPTSGILKEGRGISEGRGSSAPPSPPSQTSSNHDRFYSKIASYRRIFLDNKTLPIFQVWRCGETSAKPVQNICQVGRQGRVQKSNSHAISAKWS
jgi:hypothetical protein